MSETHLRRAANFGAVLIVAAAMAAILLFAGCAARVKTVTDLPAGVSQQQAIAYDTAIENLHRIAATTSAVRKAVIALNQNGAFPDGPAYASTLRLIGNADVLELNAVNFLKKTPSTFGLTQKQFVDAQMQAMIGELNQINQEGITGIKNPAAQKQVGDLLKQIIAAANLVLAI